jgi:hypothetical protein
MASANSIIKKYMGDEKHSLSYDILKPSITDKKKQIAEQKESYMSKLANRPTIEHNKYKELINKLKDSTDYYERVACVALATGRRMVEIVKTGQFVKAADNFITFGGQAKKRKGHSNNPYDIPVIELNADELIEIVKKLRKQKNLSKMSNTQVAAMSINPNINNIFKDIFGDGITSEAIRGAYGVIAYNLYGDKSVSESLYITRVLGHVDTDIATAATHYSRVNIDMGEKNIVSSDVSMMLLKKFDEMITLQREILKRL